MQLNIFYTWKAKSGATSRHAARLCFHTNPPPDTDIKCNTPFKWDRMVSCQLIHNPNRVPAISSRTCLLPALAHAWESNPSRQQEGWLWCTSPEAKSFGQHPLARDTGYFLRNRSMNGECLLYYIFDFKVHSLGFGAEKGFYGWEARTLQHLSYLRLLPSTLAMISPKSQP